MKKTNKIAKKLIIYIIFFSSIITLLLTITQLYIEYKADLNSLNANISNIKTGYIQGITNAVWLDDKQQLTAIIKGVNALPNIQYIEVRVNSEAYAFSGKQLKKDVVRQSFPLHYKYNNKSLIIGETLVEANLSEIYKKLINHLWILLGSNAIKTSIVVIFMYFLFNRVVFRRLNKISSFIENRDINNLNDRIDDNEYGTIETDEISEISNALNEMQYHLKTSLSELLRLKTTLDLSLDSIMMFHPNSYKFFYANTGMTKLTGYSTNEILNMVAIDICPEFNNKYLNKIAHQTIDGIDHERKVEVNFAHKSGRLIPVELILQYLNPKNEEPRFVFIANDISKRKEDEQVLLDSLEAAKSANMAKSNFMMSMSHELRTPLNAILGFSQLLELDTDSLSQSQNNAVEDILKAGRHLLKIIEDILDLTAIDSNNTPLSFERIEPVELLNDCFKMASPIAELKNIKLENKITSSLPKINVDPTRFKQVIVNLLSNAIKYNKQDGFVTLTYDLLENSIIRFKISDTGTGIKKEELSNVFKPFSRLGYEGSNIEGTGIGLNITKKLVSLMNGKIDFQSHVNEGSVFWIDFPYITSDTNNEEIPAK